ncbi:MAG: alpha-glucosidase [Sphingomonas sp.]
MKLRHLLAVLAVSVAPIAAQAAPTSSDPWWKHAVIYEIYPRSFADSNGDGVGDLNGITSHLDYLQKLGVTAIWLTPMFPSPQVDFGYDVADYEAVDPQYGTMADLDRLQAEAKKRGIKLILDMVLNHTSDKDKWFEESASSRTNPKADWYVWNDGLPADAPGVSAYQKRFEHNGRVPPNNWTSSFGGSAWEWVPARKQFYFHHFYKQQPDLNWRNPAVEKAMFDVLRFWLDRGIAGFRLDAITTLFEDPQLRNQPETGGTNAFGDPNEDIKYIDNLPEVHGVMQRMRKLVDSYPGDRVLIGETYLPNTAALKQWYGTAAHPELHVPMDMLVGFGGNEYTPAHFRPRLEAAETQLDGHQPLFVFDNHDNVRSIDRYGDGKHDVAIAKGIAAILFGSRATAMTYYGAELGMRTETPTRKEDVRDPIGIAGWPKEKGRDGERTPMQWTSGAQAGFSTNPDTWLPVPANHDTINVATEIADPQSLLAWYRTLIGLRASEPALRDGSMTMVDPDNAGVLAWRRQATGGDSVLVAINMTGTPAKLKLGAGDASLDTLAVSDGAAPVPQGDSVTLAPFQSWIARRR